MRGMSSTPPLRAAQLDSLSNPDKSKDYDALVVIAPSPLAQNLASLPAKLSAAVTDAIAADAALGRGKCAPCVVACPAAPGGRLVIATTNSLVDDLDDVRQIGEATSAAIARAVDAGAKRPLLHVSTPNDRRYVHALDVAALAALATRWYPLEAREASKAPTGAESIGVIGLDEARAKKLVALEEGRALCRDIAGTEPERMAPRRVAALCREIFAGTSVSVTVEEDVSGYPLLAAVARASRVVERHLPCVVRLEHGPTDAKHTIILCGKGVTYDTGGADLKTDGSMAGMSRDKGGAAAVAGVLRAISLLAVPGVRVIGLLGLVRNSIGEESFVSDEIIRARSGVRVRIGNTDAEGRLVLADLVAAAKEIAQDLDPTKVSILTLATLTGHVHRAYGPYIGAIGNTRAQSIAAALDTIGESWGEPMERSRSRREDYAFVAARSSAEDVVSSNRLASVATPRGHQFPFAFLDIASGIKGSALPFLHLDLAGAAVDPPDWQFGKPTGVPILTLSDWIASLSG